MVTTLDPGHIKGRRRRARILETQGKLQDAIDEYTILLSMEQLKQQTPTCHTKIDEVNKKLNIKVLLTCIFFPCYMHTRRALCVKTLIFHRSLL